jgi:hypothetical protein
VDQKAVAYARERKAVRLIYPPAHGARIAANLRRERIEIHSLEGDCRYLTSHVLVGQCDINYTPFFRKQRLEVRY